MHDEMSSTTFWKDSDSSSHISYPFLIMHFGVGQIVGLSSMYTRSRDSVDGRMNGMDLVSRIAGMKKRGPDVCGGDRGVFLLLKEK